MIKSFSALYAGHVLEGEGIGYSGTPHDDRWYPNDRLAQAFDIARESAILLEDLGYDILWMAEHHFQREGYECIPNLLILSQYLAQHTKRIKFGAGVGLLVPVGPVVHVLFSGAQNHPLDTPLCHEIKGPVGAANYGLPSFHRQVGRTRDQS